MRENSKERGTSEARQASYQRTAGRNAARFSRRKRENMDTLMQLVLSEDALESRRPSARRAAVRRINKILRTLRSRKKSRPAIQICARD
jgi:hypothetical protein